MAKEKKEAESGLRGLVYYTDGGARPTNPGYAGWGIHGYLFEAVRPKKGSGNPDHVLTTTGYVTKSDFSKQKNSDYTTQDWQEVLDRDLRDQNRYLEVTPILYVDGNGNFPYTTTNNVAELVATTQAFIHAASCDAVSSVQVYTDSEYVRKNLEENVDTWIKNNWLKPDGEPRPNVEYWKDLVKARDTLVNRGIKVLVSWIKGHDDFLGNFLADKAATIGTVTSQRIITSVNFDKSYSAFNVDVRNSPADGYWKYESNRHPLIGNRRMYFNSQIQYCTPGVYYLGDHGKDDDMLGKKSADGAYSIVVLIEPDPILEMIRQYQCEVLHEQDQIISTRLDFVYSPDIHKDLKTYGTVAMVKMKSDRGDLYHIGCLEKNASKEPFTRVLNPPKIAMRAVDAIEELSFIVNKCTEKDPNYVITDLTPIIYETVEKKGKKDELVKIQCKLKPEFVVGYSALKVNARYKRDDGQIGEDTITLTLGLDLLDRNGLKNLESHNPRISLITWSEASDIFRYATIIECDTGKAVYSGVYSNLKMVKPK